MGTHKGCPYTGQRLRAEARAYAGTTEAGYACASSR